MRNSLYVFVLLSFNFKAQIPNLSNLVKKVDPAILKVYTLDSKGDYESQGSAVIIEKSGICLSNFHVLAGCKRAIAIDFKGVKFEISKIVDYNEQSDLVKFKLENNHDVHFSAIQFSTMRIEKGTSVFTVGYPDGFNLSGGSTLSTGIVSGFRQENGENRIQITAPITHGSSGGGLFDVTGKFCGITTGTFAEEIEDRHANLNKVVPLSVIRKLINNYDLSLQEFYDLNSSSNDFIIANEYYEQKNFYMAAPYYFEHLQHFKSDYLAWFRLGNCLLNIGKDAKDIEKLEQAIGCFDIAIMWDSTFYLAYGQGALTYMYLGDFENAIVYAEMSIEMGSEKGFPYYAMGRILNQQKKYLDAIHYFNYAIKYVNDDASKSQYYLEKAIAHGWINQVSYAQSAYENCLFYNPSNEDGLFWYANFLSLNNKSYDACRIANKLYNLNPSYVMDGTTSRNLKNDMCH